MKRAIKNESLLSVNQSGTGDPIEIKIQKIMNNSEPISDSSPMIYTERDEGVLPAYDIRTDRFDIAIEAMSKVAKAQIAKRDGKDKPADKPSDKPAEKPADKPADVTT